MRIQEGLQNYRSSQVVEMTASFPAGRSECPAGVKSCLGATSLIPHYNRQASLSADGCCQAGRASALLSWLTFLVDGLADHYQSCLVLHRQCGYRCSIYRARDVLDNA
jgi:hypothetical protein